MPTPTMVSAKTICPTLRIRIGLLSEDAVPSVGSPAAPDNRRKVPIRPSRIGLARARRDSNIRRTTATAPAPMHGVITFNSAEGYVGACLAGLGLTCAETAGPLRGCDPEAPPKR